MRAGSATDRLIDALPGAPIVTVQSAAALVGRSVQAVNQAIARLQSTGVLKQITIGRRNRAFEADALIWDAPVSRGCSFGAPGGTGDSWPARAVTRGSHRRTGGCRTGRRPEL